MDTRPLTHPSPQELAAFKLRKLPADQAAAVGRHLRGCAECQQTVHGTPAEALAKLLEASPAVPPPRSGAALGGRQQAPASTPSALPPELANHEKFQILKLLGEGGMGTVYQAQHRIMERPVAIKVIRETLLAELEALQRFQAEVRAAGKLQHPNIVAAYDAERAGQLHLLVMEFVEGMTLAAYVRQKGQLPIDVACHFVRQTALGLQHACDHGMVHRDIKPQNLMVTRKGQVKILDFGLARLASERVQGAERNKTQAGAFLGTPEFIAPEQATDASKADTRADLYSLGCTLYYLLTGAPPFVGDTALKLVLAHLDQPAPSVQSVRPEVPDALAQVVAKLLEKDPARRFQKPAEVAQVLLPFCKSGTGKTDLKMGKAATALGADVTAQAPMEKTEAAANTVPIPILSEPTAPWEGLDTTPPPSRTRHPKPRTAPPKGSNKKLIVWAAAGGVALATTLAAVMALSPGKPARAERGGVEPQPSKDLLSADRVAEAKALADEKGEPADVHPVITAPVSDTKTPALDPPAATADAVTPAAATTIPDPPPAPIEFSKKAVREGFVSLFNGRDLKGWKRVGPASWTVENDVLVSRGGIGYLFRNENDYKNYHVCMEVLISPRGNSGLVLRGQNLPTGPNVAGFDHYEVDVLRTGTGNLLKTHNLQQWRVLQAVRTVEPVTNSWLTLETIAEGNRFKIKVNDKIVTVYTDNSQPFEQGLLGLQHGPGSDEVRYRNIEIKRLTEDNPESDGEMATNVPQARKKYQDVKNQARKTLLAQFDKAIDAVSQQNKTAEKRLQQIEWLKEEKQRFETRGLIPWSAPMRGHMVTYLATMKTAAGSVRKSYDPAIGKLLKENSAKARELGLELQDLLRPTIVAQWRVNATAVVTYFSNGKTNSPNGTSTWRYFSGRLILTWPDRAAPGGAWIDTLAITEDGKSYRGNNQKGAKLHGWYFMNVQ